MIQRTLVLGDFHLGNRFDKRKFLFLEKLIDQHEMIILNGDFWDDTKCSFDQFVNSGWKKLFPILKSKKTIYIHGNHDMQYESDARVNMFCKEVVNEKLLSLSDGRKVKIVHGHESSFITKLVYFFFKSHVMLLHYLTLPIDWLQKFQMELSKRNVPVEKIINWGYRRAQKNREYILITGHTHAPEFNLTENYINSGFIDHNFASYVIIVNGNIKLIKQRY